MKKITNITQLNDYCRNKVLTLSDVQQYLNKDGQQAIQAYSDINWYSSFHDSFESLLEDTQFLSLVNKNQGAEYTRIISSVINFLENGGGRHR